VSKVFDIAFKLGAELTSSFKGAFSEASSSMKFLTGAAAAVGGIGAFTAVVGQMSEMSDSLSKLSAQTGTFGADMEALEGVAKNVFRSGYGESFDEVTEALANVKQNMHNLDNGELERMTGDALMFADTFDADINEVTRAANNMMSSFGVTSTTAMDLFAAGAQRGLNFSDEMLDNVAEYAPLFGEMGYSAEEYFGILERGAKAGVYNLDYVNDVMKEFQIRSKDGSKATNEAMADLSKETQNVWKEFLKGNGTVSDVASTVVAELQGMDDQVKANQIGVGLFGTKWEDLEATAMYAMLGSTEAMEGFEGAMAKVNEVRFDTFGKAIQGIGRILFMDLVYPIGDAVLPVLNLFANYLSNNLPGAIKKAKSVLSTIAPILIGMVSAFLIYKSTLVAVAVAQRIFNTVQKTSIALYNAHRAAMIAYSLYGGGVKGITQGMAAAMRVLNITMLANPFVAVVAAVIGIGVAFYAAYKMSDKFRGAVNNLFGALKDFMSNSISYVALNAPLIWNNLVDSLKNEKILLILRMRSLAREAMEAFGSSLSGKIGTVLSGFIASFKSGLSSLPGIISLIAPMMTTMALGFLGVSGPIGWLIGAIVSIAGFLFRLSQTNDKVAGALKGAWESLSSAFAPIIQVFSDGFSQFAAEVGPQLSDTISMIATSITEMGPMFAEVGSSLAQLAVTMLSLWSGTISTLATTLLPILLQVFKMVFPMILQVIQMVLPLVINLLASIIPVILQLAQMIIPMILQVIQMVFPIVLSIIQMVLPIFATLLTTVIGVILELAQTVIPMILQVVMMVFPIVLSIIQMVIPIITMVLQMLIDVINGVLIPAINGILAVIQFVFPYVQSIIETALTIINGIIQTAMSLLQGDWDGAWNTILSTAETIMNNIISFFQGINLFDVGKAIITGLIDGIKSMGGAVLGAIGNLVPEPLKGAASKLLKNLPGFAEGGIVGNPTLAWIGEGGDTEAVIPWNNSQRSKDLWLQTGQALGMLKDNGVFDNMQDQISMQMQANNSPAISPNQVAQSVPNQNNSQVIQLTYNPQYNVQRPEDLEQVKQYADTDKDDLETRLAEIARNERRKSFG